MATAWGGGALTVSSANVGLIPSDGVKRQLLLGVERLFPTGKEDSSEFRGLMSPGSFGSPHPSPFQLSGNHSFPMGITLTVDALQIWKFNLHCKSVTHWMRFYLWFSAISAMGLLEIRVSFRADIEAFRSFIQYLSWEFDS